MEKMKDRLRIRNRHELWRGEEEEHWWNPKRQRGVSPSGDDKGAGLEEVKTKLDQNNISNKLHIMKRSGLTEKDTCHCEKNSFSDVAAYKERIIFFILNIAKKRIKNDTSSLSNVAVISGYS